MYFYDFYGNIHEICFFIFYKRRNIMCVIPTQGILSDVPPIHIGAGSGDIFTETVTIPDGDG
jgi:hypothetical protein